MANDTLFNVVEPPKFVVCRRQNTKETQFSSPCRVGSEDESQAPLRRIRSGPRRPKPSPKTKTRARPPQGVGSSGVIPPWAEVPVSVPTPVRTDVKVYRTTLCLLKEPDDLVDRRIYLCTPHCQPPTSNSRSPVVLTQEDSDTPRGDVRRGTETPTVVGTMRSRTSTKWEETGRSGP